MNRSHIPIPKRPVTKKPLSKLSRGSSLKPVSAKRVKINRIYSALRKKFLAEHPYCQWTLKENNMDEAAVVKFGGWARNGLNMLVSFPASVDIHHMKGRGKYLLDTSTWMAVSRAAHDKIHSDPKTAYEKGYLLPRT